MKKKVVRSISLKGELVSLASLSPSTTLTMKLAEVLPGKTKLEKYPVVGTTVTVQITAKTRILRRHDGKSSLRELTVGDSLRVVAKFSEADGSLVAQVVKDNSIESRSLTGKIESIDAAATSFTIKKDDKVWTVTTGTSTKFVVFGVKNATFANFKVGDKVEARGVLNLNTKILAASSVHLVRPKPTLGEASVVAKVETIDLANASFTVKKDDAMWTVKTGTSTMFVVPGVEGATLANFQVGGTVLVQGVVNKETKVVTASLVRAVVIF